MKIIFSGGGTSGHVTPALAIAEEIRKEEKDTEILFIGRTGGGENQAVINDGLKLKTLDVRGIERKVTLRNFKNLFLALTAERKAIKTIKDFSPDVVVGTGGYVCWPVLRAAQKLKIPTVIHESNLVPGMVTKLLSKKCTLTLINLESTKDYLGAKNCKTVGNPIKSDFSSVSRAEARKRLGIRNNEIFIVSYGGSLGAEKINDTIANLMRTGEARRSDVKHKHATGKRYYEKYKDTPGTDDGKNQIVPYIENMPQHLRAADIVICRCGAMTISEIAAAGVYAILIPSPNVTDNHQYKNAKHLADNGAAILIEESSLTVESLRHEILDAVKHKDKRAVIQSRIKRFATPDAGKLAANEILALAKKE